MEGDVAFRYVVAVRVGPDGILHVVDEGQGEIQRFDRDGTVLEPLGQAGEGSGEFSWIMDLEWRGDSLWVWDNQAQRLTWFDGDGELLDVRRLEPIVAEDGETVFRPRRPLPDGTILASQSVTADEAAAAERLETPELRVTEEGEVVDTLGFAERAGRIFMLRMNGAMTFPRQPFASVRPPPIYRRAAAVTHVDWTREPEPRIRVVRESLEGDTLYETSIPYRPVPLTRERVEEEVEALVARQAERMERMAERGAPVAVTEARLAERIREEFHVPEELPPVTEVVEGSDGALFLRVTDEADGLPSEAREGAPGRWLELSPEGEPVGIVELPRDLEVHWIEGDEVWGVEMDELEVPHVVRYRIVRDGEGAAGP